MQMIRFFPSPFRREAKLDVGNYHQKIVDNTYAARLKRLKEELNGPTVTEIIQMHKIQEKNQTSSTDKGTDDIWEEMPVTVEKNTTSKPIDGETLPLESQPLDRNR